MTMLRVIGKELAGLFIDDGTLALLSLVLIAVATLLVAFAGLPPLWGALLLLVGCLAILADSVRRGSRRRLLRPGLSSAPDRSNRAPLA